MSQSVKRTASRSWLLLAAFLALGSVADSAWAAQWTAGLNVSEEGGGSQDLTWGVDLAATDGIDGALGEVAQPPLPPAGNFDARLGNGALVDVRDGNALTEHSISVQFQRAAGGAVTLSWPMEFVAMTTTSARIQDQFGGVLGVDVDMRATDSIEISNAAIAAVNLVFTSADYKEPEPAASLEISAPATAFDGSPFEVTVTGLDAAGDPGMLDETIILSLGDGTGALSGDLTAIATGGVATFDNVIYNFSDDHDFTLSANDEDGIGADLAPAGTSVTAVTFGPPVLTQLSPASDENPNQKPFFAWSAVPNAATYNLKIVDNASGQVIFSEEGIADNFLLFPGSLADGEYSWRVASVTAALSTSAFSPDGMFTVVPLFTELGLVFLIVGMLTYAVWYIRR